MGYIHVCGPKNRNIFCHQPIVSWNIKIVVRKLKQWTQISVTIMFSLNKRDTVTFYAYERKINRRQYACRQKTCTYTLHKLKENNGWNCFSFIHHWIIQKLIEYCTHTHTRSGYEIVNIYVDICKYIHICFGICFAYISLIDQFPFELICSVPYFRTNYYVCLQGNETGN